MIGCMPIIEAGNCGGAMMACNCGAAAAVAAAAAAVCNVGAAADAMPRVKVAAS